MTIENADIKFYVDRITEIDAVVSEQAKKKKIYVDRLKEIGIGVYEGTNTEVTIFGQIRRVVDWKAIASKLKFSSQLLTAHTVQKEVLIAKVVGKTDRKEAA